MKKIKLTILTILISTLGFAQSKNAKDLSKENLVVDGVCKMCKKRIEKACLKTKGVKSASWSIETHNLSLIIDPTKVQLDVPHRCALYCLSVLSRLPILLEGPQ